MVTSHVPGNTTQQRITDKGLATMPIKQAIELYADSARGIYIPQHFAQSHAAAWNFDSCESDSLQILLHGPEHEHYWEAWQDVTDHAQFQWSEHTYTLYSVNGDLFSACDELMSDTEYAEFYGEHRQ